MDPSLVPSAIERLRAAWEAEVTPSVRRALVALALGSLLLSAHLARAGSTAARAGAAALLVLLVVSLAVRVVVARRRRRDLRRAVTATVGRTDPQLGAATLRAMTLADRALVDPSAGSPALARLHLTRLLGRASSERIAERALEAARRWALLGLVVAGATALVFAVAPLRIVEGLDVLAARQGTAPLPMDWVDDLELVATPPEYLHQREHGLEALVRAEEPRGSTIAVRGRALHPGRRLVLTDGVTEVPFVEDGARGVVARWTLKDTTDLFVAARFGEVRIPQIDRQPLFSIADEPPRVDLERAPRTIRLLDEPSIPVHYEATDDHGLREVHLVLRAGLREERRALSTPQADTKVDRGGYELRAADPFFRRTFVPIEVRVEARDNDVVAGPKWGKSQPFILVPPQVGEPEALRYEALCDARDALVDLLAARTKLGAPAGAGGAAHGKAEADAQEAARAAVQKALEGSFGGAKVRGAVATIIRGQLRRIAAALEAERKAPSTTTHEALLAATETTLLAFDSAVRAQGVRDSKRTAQRLAEVADEAAASAAAHGIASERPSAAARLDAALTVLEGGGHQLLRLGDLGVDLGQVVGSVLPRIKRARGAEDWHHAELAARDLAERLRRPEPSFRGGGGGGHGVESGSGGSAPPDPNEASAADQEMAAAQQELERLARDHAGEMNDVAQALERAGSQQELDALREEAKRHAEAIRKAVESLPRPGADPGSAEAAAAAGREQAESMAGSLDRGNPADALESGKQAQRQLDEAKRLGDQAQGFFPEERAGREASRAAETVRRELEWLEDAMAKLRRAASERAKPDLAQSGDDEDKLADRTKELAKKGDQAEASMPEEMLDHLDEAEQAMRDARRALKEGDGENGSRHQQRAQRALEMAQSQGDEGEGDDGKAEQPHPKTGDGKAPSREKTDIPGQDKHKGPEDFRRRVMQGLGGPADPVLKRAVRRYAEGLLR